LDVNKTLLSGLLEVLLCIDINSLFVLYWILLCIEFVLCVLPLCEIEFYGGHFLLRHMVSYILLCDYDHVPVLYQVVSTLLIMLRGVEESCKGEYKDTWKRTRWWRKYIEDKEDVDWKWEDHFKNMSVNMKKYIS